VEQENVEIVTTGLPLPKDDHENYVTGTPVIGDSYSNPAARLGVGTPNLAQTGNYPLIRLTEDYPLILSLYRSSWIVRKVVDQIANDTYKKFPMITGDLKPDQVRALDTVIKKTGTLGKMRSARKWGRLFGGAAGIIVIEGHNDLMQPLDLDDVEIGSYKGIIPLDRWSGIIPGPEISSDINDCANFGLPTYYNCVMDSGQINVHHSRILRFCGRELPQWELQVELYWGMSEVEIMFDELQKRDYSSWNIVSLLTRAQVLSVEEPQLATLMSGVGGSNKNYDQFIQRMTNISNSLNNQGLMILGKDGKLQTTQYGFGGISNVYHEFMKDLAASTDIPYEIIFGRESGLGSNSEGSLQLYDNLIGEKRESDEDPIMNKLIPVIAMSTLGHVPDNLGHSWTPFRALSQEQRTNLGRSTSDTITESFNSDLITKREARQALKDSSSINGMFDSITKESIAATPDKYASELGMGELGIPEGEGGDLFSAGEKKEKPAKNKRNRDRKKKNRSDTVAKDSFPAVESEALLNPVGLLDWISNKINLFRASR
jgi:phage-related protein (TIGR01555 family)